MDINDNCDNKIYFGEIFGGNLYLQWSFCRRRVCHCCGGFLHLNHRQTFLEHQTLLYFDKKYSTFLCLAFHYDIMGVTIPYLYFAGSNVCYKMLLLYLALPYSSYLFESSAKFGFRVGASQKVSSAMHRLWRSVFISQLHHQHQ